MSVNGRGNGALQKIGAVREALLRKSFLKDGQYHDQVLWAITADEWQFVRMPVRNAASTSQSVSEEPYGGQNQALTCGSCNPITISKSINFSFPAS